MIYVEKTVLGNYVPRTEAETLERLERGGVVGVSFLIGDQEITLYWLGWATTEERLMEEVQNYLRYVHEITGIPIPEME